MSPTTKKAFEQFSRELVIKNYSNGDSELEISRQMLCSRNTTHSMIMKYKKTRCIVNMVDCGRKRKTTTRVDQLIQLELKVERHRSPSSIEHEIMDELKIAISSRTVNVECMDVSL